MNDNSNVFSNIFNHQKAELALCLLTTLIEKCEEELAMGRHLEEQTFAPNIMLHCMKLGCTSCCIARYWVPSSKKHSRHPMPS
jgi:hypothetical protein